MSAPVTCITWHDFAAATSPATAHLGATTAPDAFARQLDHIERRYTVISLDRLLAGDIPPRAALLTIDDAYASIARVAAPELARRRLPAVLFANPAPIRDGFIPLDALASLVASRVGAARLAFVGSGGALAADTFGAFIDGYVAPLSLEGRAAVKRRLLDHLDTTEAALHRALDLFMTPRELAGLPACGIEVANHTATHVHCGALAGEELDREIVAARDALADMTGHPVRAFAFPWGRRRDATDAVMDIVRRSGHRATFLVHGRNNTRRPADDIWYRVLLRNESGARLAAALTHLPRLRELRARLSATDEPSREPGREPQQSAAG